MPISVASPRRSGRSLAVFLRRLVRLTLAAEGRRPAEVGIRLTDDREMRRLNRRYRGLDRATDVLSFEYDAPGGEGREVHGDVVVSIERMEDQARRFRSSRGAELARLVVHGTLHLAGLDHATPPQRRAMRARERSALRRARLAVKALEAILDRPASRRQARR